MAGFITDQCTHCGVCIEECPVACISVDTDRLVIDDSVCIGCEACVAVCHENAIQPKK